MSAQSTELRPILCTWLRRNRCVTWTWSTGMPSWFRLQVARGALQSVPGISSSYQFCAYGWEGTEASPRHGLQGCHPGEVAGGARCFRPTTRASSYIGMWCVFSSGYTPPTIRECTAFGSFGFCFYLGFSVRGHRVGRNDLRIVLWTQQPTSTSEDIVARYSQFGCNSFSSGNRRLQRGKNFFFGV